MRIIDGANLCLTMEDISPIINRLSDEETKYVVYDAETNGLDARTNYICGHVISFSSKPEDNFYVPVRHEGVNISSPGLFEKSLNDIFSSRRNLTIIGHNVQFDMDFLFNAGISCIGNIIDTMVVAALINEHESSFSLDRLCKVMGVQNKKGDELYNYISNKFGGVPDKKQMANFYKLSGDDPMAVSYAIGDGISTYQLWEAQKAEIIRQDLTSIYELENAVTRVLVRMRRIGVKIDLDRLEEVKSWAEESLCIARQTLPDDFPVRSSAAIQRIMEGAGHVDWPMTAPTSRYPNGQPQFNETWLTTNPIGQNIIKVRKFEHFLNSFIIPLQKEHIYNGRIYPNFHQTATGEFGTISGRFSCSKPNLQQVHKRNEEYGKRLRSCFVPDEGKVWYEQDMSQAEPRLLAHYSSAKVLLDGYLANPPLDSHTAVKNYAESIGLDISRFAAKTVQMLLIAGGGKAKTVAILGEKGEEIYNNYFKIMPELKAFQKTAASVFEQRGYIKTILGRKIRLLDPSKSFVATNRLLQGSNADLMKKALVDIDKLFEDNGDKSNILCTIHDALSFQACPEDRELSMEALRLFIDFGINRSVFMKINMACEWGYGSDWGIATFDPEEEGVLL